MDEDIDAIKKDFEVRGRELYERVKKLKGTEKYEEAKAEFVRWYKFTLRYINYLDKLEGGAGDWHPGFDIDDL